MDFERLIERIKRIVTRGSDYRDAIRILEGTDRETVNKVLKYFEENEPQVYVSINERIIFFEDLKNLTTNDILDLLKSVDTQSLGKALRLQNEDVRESFTQGLGKSDKEEVEAILNGPPIKKSEALEACNRILKIIREKVKNGEVDL